MIWKWFSGVALVMGFLIAFPDGGWGGGRIVIDQAHIIVNDKMVTKREVERSRELQEREYRGRFKGEELEAKLRDMDKALTDQIIQTLLLEARAEELGIQISDEEIEERVSSILKRDPRINGVYSDLVLKEFVVKDLLQKRVIQREVTSRIFVDEDAIRKACGEELREGREIDVGHILLTGGAGAVEQKLRTVKERLAAGIPFEDVATEFSEDPAARRNKGRLGFIAHGQFVKEFEKAAFALALGELGGPVQTKFGHHMIMVFGERMKEGLDCEKLSEAARKRLKTKVWNRMRNEEMKKYLAKLKKDAEIIVLK